MKKLMDRIGAAMALLGLCVAGAFAQVQEPDSPERFIRVTEDNDAGVLRLEIAIREYAAQGSGPVVSLVGAVHIADSSFYTQLQSYLDSRDVVLFEGVKPPGAGDVPADATDDRRAQLTKRRLRFIATVVQMYQRDTLEYPEDLSSLGEGVDRRIVALIADSPTDAWGHPLVYELDRKPLGGSTFDLISLGADGEVGGEGADADLAFSDQPELTREEIFADKEDGIQGQLADALGLVFQLNAMDHNGEQWRNSDLSMDEIMDLLDSSGVSGDELFGALSGDTIMSKIMGFGLRLVGSSPTMQVMLKVMLLDVLSVADQVLAAAPGEMGKLMEVLINDRNAVVMDDLDGIVADEQTVRTVGIIYGAGHLADLQQQLHDRGYEPIGVQWVPAIEVNLADSGIPAWQLKSMRSMMKRTLDKSLEQLDR